MRSASEQLWNWAALLCCLAALLCLIQQTDAVKEHDFKKCNQSGFCKRNRDYADRAEDYSATWSSPYQIVPESVALKEGQLQAMVLKTLNANRETARFPLTVSFLKSGLARVTMDEERRQKGDIELRHNSHVRKERYNEVDKWAIVGGLELDPNAQIASQDQSQMVIKYGPDSTTEAFIKFSPFRMDFRRNGETHIKFNSRGLLNIEHWRPKVDKPQSPEGNDENKSENQQGEAESQPEKQESETENKPEGGTQDGTQDATQDGTQDGEDESTWWDESFGGNTDSKPRGPESVALDITFLEYGHVYGIPEHTGPMSLKPTRGEFDDYLEPYRMYNSDVFEYVLDSPMTLYGSIPFMQAHRKGSSVGVFWLNAAETWVDIVKAEDKAKTAQSGSTAKTSTHTHWISENGLLDVFVLMGPTPSDLTHRYGELTGYTTLPPEFSIGYHQCRWNYISDEDLRDVDRKMDKFNIPYDVIWLDIEYTEDRKYFTWEPHSFPDPITTGQLLDIHGRKLVVIIDPHIKKLDTYVVSQQLTSQDLAVHNKDNEIFEGWCWPGSSNWVDCFNPKANEWWKTLFKYKFFNGTMENTFLWNDMNEPSVFNGPETTMPKDNIHFGNWEHRDVHNLNGLTFHKASYDAMVSRKEGERQRPFILTRSFYAGSQRLGAMWTGDNQAEWGHLAASIPMILNQGISGYPFAGADVGGFFGNPEKDLMARWYQAGAFYPFFRGHAHIDSRRREPYLLPRPYRQIVTAALRLRYSLLPSWYTAFFQASKDGSPIVRPMFWTHPDTEGGFAIDDQFFLGSTGLLVKPIVEKDQVSTEVWIPDGETYFDYKTYHVMRTEAGKKVTVEAKIDEIPLLMRGGHIFPRRDIPRRSSAAMRFDDYTLMVVVAKNGRAEGELYADDGSSFDHGDGQYIHRKFVLETNTLSSVDAKEQQGGAVKAGDWLKAMSDVSIDRIIIVGAPAAWDRDEVKIVSESRTWNIKVQYHKADKGRAAFAVVGRVGAAITDDWSISLG